MTIDEFEAFCEKYPGLEINFEPYDCGSWRGVYAEPCIFIREGKAVLSDFLPFLETLKSATFWGYKGGEYEYEGVDPLNFELEPSRWSYGETQQRMLNENPYLAEVWPF